MFSVFVFTVFAIVAADITWPFKECKDDAPFHITSVTITAVPIRNLNDTYKIIGRAQQPLKMKNSDLEVLLNGHHLDTINVNYTQQYDEGDKITFNYTNFAPSFAPPGTYTMHFQFKTVQNERVGCVQVQFKL